MPELSTLILFCVAALVLLVTPGPAVLYIVARSIDQGKLAGIASAMGVGIGTLVHVTAAALGLSAILLSSATAFNMVKYLGAAYLMYLGVRKFMERDEPVDRIEPEVQPLSRVFTQGIVVNILNPKLALFFFAFVPQFIAPERGPVATQTLILGTIFVVLGIFSDSIYAMLAGAAGAWLKQSRGFLRGQRYFAGSAYVALGVVAAFSGSRHK